jgi:antitoxin component of RelBE/YafQ-DinJ toxin-antitoxin module
MKSAAMRIRVEPELHDEFLTACKNQDLPASQVLRQFMKAFIEENIQGSQQELFEISKTAGKNNK